MEQINWWKVAVIGIVALLLFGLGFYIGRKQEPQVITKYIVKYEQLPPVHDTTDKPVPYYVKEPVDTVNVILECIKSGLYSEMFPNTHSTDTIYVTPEDTSMVIRDWATERKYVETLFDIDTLGKFVLNATVQYNRLDGVGYDYTPVQKQTETTIKTTRSFLPYVGGGLNTAGMFMAQGGMFFKQDAGFGVQYNYDPKTKTNSVGALFLWMF